MKPRSAVALAFAAGMLVGTPALAAKPDPRKPAERDDSKTEWGRLRKEADALMDVDKYAEALALYARAYELSHDPALLYNQARALEAMGEYPDALDKLEQFERDASASLRAKVPGLRDLMSDLRGRISTIVVSTNARGARLLVREKAAGTIDRELKMRTRAGPATIEVVAEGFESFKRLLDLKGGDTVTLDARLVSKSKDAIIVVKTTPTADVMVDNRPVGRAPIELKLAPGTYVLSAHAEGREDDRRSITLQPTEKRELSLDLKKTPPITAKWWFWTGIGVVIAGGVGTYFALTTEKSHGEGTLGSVPGP